jgi:hypothetical protein
MFEDILFPQIEDEELDEWIEFDLTVDEYDDLTELPDFGDIIGC